MIKKVNKSITEFKNIIYIIIGVILLLILCLLIYRCILAGHLSRDIPFMLTEFWFYLLLILCINYLYAIKINIKPSVPSFTKLKIISCITYLIVPLLFLDNFLKTNNYCYVYTIKSIKHIIPPYGGKGQRMFLVILHLIPRILLVVIFIFDIFWFNKLNNFYNYIFLGLLPLIYNYHKFTMYQIKELAIQHLESLYMEDYVDLYEVGYDDIPIQDNDSQETTFEYTWSPHIRNKHHLKVVSIREYFQIELEKSIDDIEHKYTAEDIYELDPKPMPKDNFIENYKKLNGKQDDLTMEDYDILDREFKSIAFDINSLALSLHYLPQNEKRGYIHILNLMIYGLYVLGWGYILIKSIDTLTNLPITMSLINSVIQYLTNTNPFINP